MSLHKHQNLNMDHDMNMDKNMNMNMQKMSFHWSKTATVLFSGWPGESLPRYIWSLLFVFTMAAVVEFLSIPAAVDKGTGTVPTLAAYSRAFVYAIRIGLAYLVMLSLMSFNGGIFVAAIAGHVVGFFIVKAGALRRSNHNQEEDLESHV